MNKLMISGLLAALPGLCFAEESVFGYTNGNQGRSTLFRTATQKTGMAIKIPSEKVKVLKGCSISAVEAAVGSVKSSDGKISVFVATSLDGTAATEGVFDLEKANSWQRYTLEQPYVITGEEECLYFGYTLDIPSSYTPLSADQSVQMDGVTFALFGDEWRDIADMNVGQGNVRLVVDDAPAITDIAVKPLAFGGYYKEGETYDFSGQLLNLGNVRIDNFTLSLQIGDGKTETFSIAESIEPGSTYDFNIPQYTASQTGMLGVTVGVTETNGGEDSEMSDNTVSTEICFYPSDMERAILVEGFTGQECSQCPRGHMTISEVIAEREADPSNSELVEVTHHAGYYPDSFTMVEDVKYTSLYPGSTYAPAVMVNRMRNATTNAPVFDVSTSALQSAIDAAEASQPYVSIKLDSDFDPDTRKLDVKVEAYAHNDIPAQVKVINVMLCQNNIVAKQSGMGNKYEHSHVFRGCLTGNAWGVTKAFEKGSVETLELEYTLPQAIAASYWTENNGDEYLFDAIPEDMYLVAYVGAYDDKNQNQRYIVNCAKVNLGESKEQGGFVSGLRDVSTDGAVPTVRLNDGHVSVDGGYRNLEIYNVSGARIANGNVRNGMYVIRVVSESGEVHVRKVMAR